MKSKAYRAADVKKVAWQQVVAGREGQDAILGFDVGKRWILTTLRWSGTDFERPWRVSNPGEVRYLAERVAWLKEGRRLVVAMEPTGTYGDVLRQALAELNVAVQRVSPKMASWPPFPWLGPLRPKPKQPIRVPFPGPGSCPAAAPIPTACTSAKDR